MRKSTNRLLGKTLPRKVKDPETMSDIELINLKREMQGHDTLWGVAVVVLTARQMQRLLNTVEALKGRLE